MPKLSGAYVITHVKTGQVYVGSCSDLANRKLKHESFLRRNLHFNKKLQDAFNSDPELKFFLVITENREEAYKYEQELLDKYKDTGRLCNSSLHAKSPHKGIAHSDEAKEKMRLNSAWRGKRRTFSDETKRKLSEAAMGRGKGVKRDPSAVAGLLRANQAKARPVSICGVRYESVTSAAAAVGLSYEGLAHRLSSKRFEDHYYL